MKTIAVVGMLMILGASSASAGAEDIKGKWGIGAGVFGGGGEVSLIRGKSERSAWLFDVFATQRYDSVDPEVTPPIVTAATTRRSFSIVAGPGYRRFMRPKDEFSPYWDVRARYSYARFSETSSTDNLLKSAGLRADLSIGLEYFTRWHFSVAAHSGLAQIQWNRTVQRVSVPGQELRFTQTGDVFSLGLSPVLFVRGYF